MNPTKNAEPLWQTPDQQTTGAVTFRVYIDDAWRDIEGWAEWKKLSQRELIDKIEEAYYTPK